MIKALLVIVTLFLAGFLFAQEESIEWGEIQRKQGRLIEVLSPVPGEFYTLRWLGGNIGGSYYATRNIGLERVERKRIRLIVNKSIATFEAVGIVDNDFTVFLSDKQDGAHNIYMQRYDESLNPKGDQVYLGGFPLKVGVKGNFDVAFSKDNSHFGVFWSLPGKKERKHVYGFNVFNRNVEKVNDGEYPLQFDPKFVRVLEHQVSNTGDYFMAFAEYERNEKSFLKNKQQFKDLHVYHVNDDGLQDFIIDIGGKRIEAMAMSMNQANEFVVTGIYGEHEVQGVSGMFHQRMDLKTGKQFLNSVKDFDEDFIKEGWSQQAIRRADRREERGKGEAQLQHHQMQDVATLSDGSLLGTMEQYYVQVQSSADPNDGTSSDRYYYYFNDIIAFKIDSTGKFDWIQKIPKYQVSMNDGGPYSSFASYVSDSVMSFVFNDSKSNYSQSGAFLESSDIQTANYSKKRNVVALAEINVETGEVERKVFFGRSDISTIAVPKLFDINYQSRQVLLYSIWGKNEKVGVMKF